MSLSSSACLSQSSLSLWSSSSSSMNFELVQDNAHVLPSSSSCTNNPQGQQELLPRRHQVSKNSNNNKNNKARRRSSLSSYPSISSANSPGEKARRRSSLSSYPSISSTSSNERRCRWTNGEETKELNVQPNNKQTEYYQRSTNTKMMVPRPLPLVSPRSFSAPTPILVATEAPKLPTRTFTPEQSLALMGKDKTKKNTTKNIKSHHQKTSSLSNFVFKNNSSLNNSCSGFTISSPIKVTSPVKTLSPSQRAQSILSILGSLSPTDLIPRAPERRYGVGEVRVVGGSHPPASLSSKSNKSSAAAAAAAAMRFHNSESIIPCSYEI